MAKQSLPLYINLKKVNKKQFSFKKFGFDIVSLTPLQYFCKQKRYRWNGTVLGVSFKQKLAC